MHMCISKYAYLHIYSYACMCLCTHTYICAYPNMHICTCVHMCTHIYSHRHIHICNMHRHGFINEQINNMSKHHNSANVYFHIYTYAHMFIYVCTNIYTLTYGNICISFITFMHIRT